MPGIYKSEAGAREVLERYLAFLHHWPVPHRQHHVSTHAGETFVIESGPVNADPQAPPLILLHGGLSNSIIWMGDVASWSRHFRVFAVDLLGEPGLSAPARLPLSTAGHAQWLEEVMEALAIDRAAIVGVSLGGWLALDFAIRRPHRVSALALICPGGVGRQKLKIVFQTLALRMFGAWGKRKARELVLGKPSQAPLPPAIRNFADFIALLHRHVKPRMVKLPIFTDAQLAQLTMPLLAIVGGNDVLLDSAATRRRLEARVPSATVDYHPEAGHFLPGQGNRIHQFLTGALGVGVDLNPAVK